MNRNRAFRRAVHGMVLLAALSAAAETRVLDGLAAAVNEKLITVGDVMKLVAPLEQQLRRLHASDAPTLEAKLRDAYDQALNSLIERQLILSAFAKKGANLPDRAVEQQVGELLRNNFKNDRSLLQKALAEERLSMEEWRGRLREEIVVGMMVNEEVRGKVRIPPGAVRAEYDGHPEDFAAPEKVRLRMLSLSRGSTDEERAQKAALAADLRRRIAQGEEFAELARQHSDDIKAAEGGDRGWLDPATLRAELAAAARALPPGVCSEVLDTGDKLYILRVEERKGGAVVPFEEAQRGIEEALRQKEFERLYVAWMARLKARNYVKLF